MNVTRAATWVTAMLAVSSLPVAWLVWTRPMPAIAPPVPQRAPRALAAGFSIPDSVRHRISRAGPFRETRVPAPRRFDARLAVATPAVLPLRPVLVLSGIVWGHEPGAIIDGLPGIEGGRLLRRGDRVGEIAVTSITRDQVRLRGFDSTWILRVREVR